MIIDEREPIRQLVERGLEDISAHRYASTTQANYRGFYHHLMKYADSRGIGAYSPEFGRDFFHSRYRCRLEDVPSPAPRRFSGPRRNWSKLSPISMAIVLIVGIPHEPPERGRIACATF